MTTGAAFFMTVFIRYFASILFFGLLAATAVPQVKPSKISPAKSKPTAARSKPSATNPKPVATPSKKASEKAEFDKAVSVTDVHERISALRKFAAAFPKSSRMSEAVGMIAADEAALGNEKLAAGDPEAALKFFKAAVADAPKPLPEPLFLETLSKFPANLYFRGLRQQSFEIAKSLENKAETNAAQLLKIAEFYISIENGSEAKRLSESALKIDANSSAAYQMLGLADRVDFQLEQSAAAYAKALELEPESLTARRGLAEMKRSLGLADAAVALYREILAKDETNLPAKTGLILAFFEADKRADAETEMAKSLEANPGNIMLLAGAAYWYAAHNNGVQAAAFAQKAIEADPRFIWSHISLARAFMIQGKPLDAERTLLAARRYGNFPTLEYELASARLAAGLYREAGEELAKSFSVRDGVVHSNLGGRVPVEAKGFSELVGLERRASIFAPVAAEESDAARQLRSLLELKQELDANTPRAELIAKAADDFASGSDKMKIHRQIFAASELLDKKIALAKAVEIVKAAPANLESGLDIPEASTAVMAGELYESRTLALTRGQYINVPVVPRPTLTAVLRGRIEEITGWAFYEMDDAAQAVIHLKRAAGVLPADSAWWRSTTWRLGTALVVSGKEAEGLEAYIRFYKSGGQTPARYNAIESLYRRIHGNTFGLEERIGANPSAPVETVAQKNDAPNKTDAPSIVPVAAEPSFTPSVGASPAADAGALPSPAVTINEKAKAAEIPSEVATEQKAESLPTPDIKPEATPGTRSVGTLADLIAAKPSPAPSAEKASQTPKDLFPPIIITIPAPDTAKSVNKGTDANGKAASETRTEEQITNAEVRPSPTPEISKPVEQATMTPTPADESPKPSETPLEKRQRVAEGSSETSGEIKPCRLNVSEESVTLQNGGGLAIIVGRENDEELEGLDATSTSPDDVSVRREMIEGVKTRALFVLRSISAKSGVYQVKFTMPCGERELTVKVR